MFKLMKLLLPTVAALLAAAPAVAADRISADTATVIIEKSGVSGQLADFAPSIRAGITTQPELASKLTEAQLATLLQAFDEAYAPARLAADINAELIRSLKPAVARDALGWLESELGSRITALEDGATELANDPDKMAAAQTLMERLPPRRAERYIALMKATGADESGAQIMLNSSLGIAYAAAATLSATRPDFDALRKELESSRPQMVEALGNAYLVMFASVYQDVAEADLDRYLAFAESPSGKAYHRAVTAALDVALTRAAREAGRQVGDAERTRKGRAAA